MEGPRSYLFYNLYQFTKFNWMFSCKSIYWYQQCLNYSKNRTNTDNLLNL